MALTGLTKGGFVQNSQLLGSGVGSVVTASASIFVTVNTHVMVLDGAGMQCSRGACKHCIPTCSSK